MSKYNKFTCQIHKSLHKNYMEIKLAWFIGNIKKKLLEIELCLAGTMCQTGGLNVYRLLHFLFNDHLFLILLRKLNCVDYFDSTNWIWKRSQIKPTRNEILLDIFIDCIMSSQYYPIFNCVFSFSSSVICQSIIWPVIY